MVLVSGIIIRNGFIDKKITEQNILVEVTVIDCSEFGKRNYFLDLEYNGKTFTKRTKKQYCERLNKRDKIEMLANKTKDEFIFINEYKNDNDFVYGFILLGIGLIITYKGWAKK